MWSRKNKFERSIGALESNTATATEELATAIRERFPNETGQQIAENLARLAKNVEQLDLSDAVLQRRKELEKAAKKASRQVDRAIKDLDKTRSRVARDANALAARVGESVEQGGQQLATLSQKTVPPEPAGWIMPSFVGFLFGFGAGFLVARKRRQEPAT
ncbi:MAG: hypothetical protein HGA45_41930 [Chloroflexales bacterium]|nr:hypothetical protein [Chloroflexales bacterium]